MTIALLFLGALIFSGGFLAGMVFMDWLFDVDYEETRDRDVDDFWGDTGP